MRRRKTEKIRKELQELIVKQTEALKAQTFGGLTDKEAREYDRRQEKIHELCARLATTIQEESEESAKEWRNMPHPAMRRVS